MGLFEHFTDSKYGIAKITFGQEPKDYEILTFISDNFHKLKFSYFAESDEAKPIVKPINPKRMQRVISKQINSRGPSTKSQTAIQKQKEDSLLQRKKLRSKTKKELSEKKYEMRKEKQKSKHKGR